MRLIQHLRNALQLAILLIVSAAGALGAEPNAVVQARDGLTNFFRYAVENTQAGEPTRIVYLGGAITKGAGASREDRCYRAMLTRQFKEMLPKTSLVEHNYAIAGTGSWLAAFRASNDAGRHYQPTGLVVIEFTADDASEPEQRVKSAMEGILRQIRAAVPQADILLLYSLRKGQTPDVIRWQEQVAAHYGVASVNVTQFAATKIAEGKLTADAFSHDGLLPTDQGHALYVEAIKPLLIESQTAAKNLKAATKHSLPKPLGPSPLDKACLVSYEQTTREPAWRVGQESPIDPAAYTSSVGRFRHVLVCDQPGVPLTLRFKGDSAGCFDAVGPDTGDLECSVDDGPWQLRPVFTSKLLDPKATAYRLHATVLAEGLDPAKEHELRLRVAEAIPQGSRGRTARIGYFLLNGKVLFDDPFQGMSPVERIDAIYSTIAPVKYTAAPDRWKYLPNTMRRLRQGDRLKIVMLGDSIINDTGSSQYELLLERIYEKCKVEKIRSVRGSTGCWWYKLENHVKPYVLDHKPDLLMIGGISQRDDVESIREVIHQVRAVQPSVEVLVMTPVFGTTEPRSDKAWSYTVDPNGKGYRSELMRMAAQEKVEFLDMTGPWGQYIRESDKARGWFMRDVVHANDRGFQILGRILETYFSPDPPK